MSNHVAIVPMIIDGQFAYRNSVTISDSRTFPEDQVCVCISLLSAAVVSN